MTFLELYALDWARLKGAIGSRDRVLEEYILRKVEPDWSELFEDGQVLEADWEKGIHHWIFLPKRPEGQEGEVQGIENAGEQLGFVALVLYLGRLAGSLDHSISSGEFFRETFLEQTCGTWLRPTFPMDYLLSRPILGYESEDFPYWGGLLQSEIGSVRERLMDEEAIDFEDENLAGWAEDLQSALTAILEDGTDLVTLYHD